MIWNIYRLNQDQNGKTKVLTDEYLRQEEPMNCWQHFQLLFWFDSVGDYLHRIYPNELEVNDTTDIQKSSSYLDLHLEVNNGGRLKN
jgi:hypothetical protein